VLFNRRRLAKIEGLAGGHAFQDIHEDNVGQLFLGNAHGSRGSNMAGSNNGYFFSHDFAPLLF
jgi:hypothetical protein